MLEPDIIKIPDFSKYIGKEYLPFRKIKWKRKKEKSNITLGKRNNETGFCNTYVNGEKTDVQMLVFKENEVEKLHECLK